MHLRIFSSPSDSKYILTLKKISVVIFTIYMKKQVGKIQDS